MGCDQSVYFSLEELIYHFQMIGKVLLIPMLNPTISTIRSQGWLSVVDLYLTSEWDSYWNNYIITLQREHARIGPLEDEFIWGRNIVGGSYLAKLGYKDLFGP
jgi:hypothetical protein